MMDINEDSWHLSQNQAESEVTNFELQLWRVFHGFLRWQEECEKSTNETGLNGHELAVLHIVRMKDKAKSISDIGRILNRNDLFNINYILRKLLKKKLVKKLRAGDGQKAFLYQITPEGIENTQVFSDMRRKVLVQEYMKETIPLRQLADNLIKIRSIYNQADSIVAYTTITKSPSPKNTSLDISRSETKVTKNIKATKKSK